jgi:hypothetical protein
MQKTFYILFLTLTVLDSTYSQILNKEYVDSWILGTIPNSLIDSSTAYIINGLPFDSKSVNQELCKYNQDDIVTFNFLDKLQFDTLKMFKPPSSIILLTTKGNQTRQSIESDFAKAKRRFLKRDLITTADIDTSLKEPVLIINGNQIFHKDCYQRINSIKKSDITGINLIERPVSNEIYGSNGVNGLIIIKTKKIMPVANNKQTQVADSLFCLQY